MPASYRGITIPDDNDWADIAVAFRAFLDTVEPVGIVKMFGGTAAPSGYLLCNGAAIPAGTAYDALRTLIGANTPDFRGRSPFGPGANGITLNATGGEQTHVLTATELAGHQHTINHDHGSTGGQSANHTHNSGDGSNFLVAGQVGTQYAGTSIATGGHQVSITTGVSADHSHVVPAISGLSGSAGSGSAHNNMPPYTGINFIIKY